MNEINSLIGSGFVFELFLPDSMKIDLSYRHDAGRYAAEVLDENAETMAKAYAETPVLALWALCGAGEPCPGDFRAVTSTLAKYLAGSGFCYLPPAELLTQYVGAPAGVR